jgi:lipoate-protein ligase A
MAVDEMLLDAAERHQQCTLRFYQWSEPTLSLGYFQAHADRESHLESRSCPLVRRTTGGGAILHDIELTYSFVCPIGKADADSQALYRAFHATLIQVLAAEFQVNASMIQTKDSASPPPFLCFQRRSEGDVVIGDWKIAGSAQRRRRGAVLQHGSILQGVSENAPELLGIREVARVDLHSLELVAPWVDAIGDRISLRFGESELSKSETEAAREIERQRFSANSWTSRR